MTPFLTPAQIAIGLAAFLGASVTSFAFGRLSMPKAPQKPREAPPALRISAVRLCRALLLAEAGGEGISGMQGVTQVIRTRMVRQNRICQEILLTPSAFSCLNRCLSADRSGFSEIGLACFIDSVEGQPWPRRILSAAGGLAAVLANPYLDPAKFKGPFPGKHPDHYCHINAHPGWRQELESVGTLGHHIFFDLQSPANRHIIREEMLRD